MNGKVWVNPPPQPAMLGPNGLSNEGLENEEAREYLGIFHRVRRRYPRNVRWPTLVERKQRQNAAGSR